MALINCPDCGKEISESAPACPGCGSPIADRKEAVGSGVQHLTTVQETSKKFKVHTMLSVTLLIVGIVLLFGDVQEPGSDPSPVPFAMVSIGLTWYLVNRFRIWWHHK